MISLLKLLRGFSSEQHLRWTYPPAGGLLLRQRRVVVGFKRMLYTCAACTEITTVKIRWKTQQFLALTKKKTCRKIQSFLFGSCFSCLDYRLLQLCYHVVRQEAASGRSWLIFRYARVDDKVLQYANTTSVFALQSVFASVVADVCMTRCSG